MLRCAALLCLSTLLLAAAEFPVKSGRSGRYLVDARNKPFLYHADTAWMLFLKLTLEEADEYLEARQRQGFNTIQVQLTGFLGMTNRAGEFPFDRGNDFLAPNEKFFGHVDAVLEKARAKNLLLAIAPLWSGCCGEGWAGRSKEGQLMPINANGPEKMAQFGNWLAKRYGRYQNIIWILGGDNDPHNAREEIRALALALKKSVPHQLLTHHASSSHSSTDVWPGENWIDLPMVYTYFRGFNKAWNKNQPDVYEVGWKEHSKTPARPFIHGESTYEGEHNDWGSPLQARKQAYWAVLSGATGHAYGSPNWNFPRDWREQIGRPGAETLRHLRAFFETMDWHRLVPDSQNKFAVKGIGPAASNDLAVAAVAEDKTFAVAYLPGKRAITFDLTQLLPHEIQVIWYNPRTGERTLEGRMGKSASTVLEPRAAGDWVLLFE